MKKVLLLLLTFAVVFTMVGAVSAVEITGDANADKQGEMTAELPIAESYVVSFPEKVSPAVTDNGYTDITAPVVISVSNAIIDPKRGLFITLESANEFTIKSGDKSSVQYVVGIGDENDVYTDISNGWYVSKVFAEDTIDGAKTTNLKFYTTNEWISKAKVGGSHTDTLTFTCSIENLVSSNDDLKTAITDAATSGEPATVYLGEGTYTFPSSSLKKDVTLVCEEGTVFEGTSGLNINGATVIGATFDNPNGNAVSGTINGVIKDCTFTGSNGLRECYAGETVVFENCVFSGDLYGVHFDGGANDIRFVGCTFSGFNAFGNAVTKLTFEDCTFKSNKRSSYNGVNLWGNTELIDCEFIFDGTATTEWVDLCTNDLTVTFTDCVVVVDALGTTKSIKDVVGNYGNGNTIIIDGDTVNIPNMS